ncbi:protein SPA1-RELATED 4-like isoform X2 [Phoenix dactylifera]|uniref:Protein SPA1-RELATED 4-like isoform X2 n=1 Tax=Phoenix dactylifera TaxID=42345 RepID=A0A8B7C490_PHODC|nr:protein SPA1-RELATED 4-like isoform X2 [Phoenix dactylifera]
MQLWILLRLFLAHLAPEVCLSYSVQVIHLNRMEGNAEVNETIESSTEATHLKRKENDQPPQQPDSHNALETAAPVVSQEADWPENFSLLRSPEMFLETIAGKKISYNTASQSGSEPLFASPRSSNDPGVMVEELSLKNYKSPSLSIGGSSSSGERPPVRKGLWQNFTRLADGLRDVAPKESMTMAHQEDTGKVFLPPPGVQRPPPCINLDPNHSKVSEHLAASDNCVISSNAPTRSPSWIRTKVLPASGFPQFLIKNTLKGKGVAYRPQGTHDAPGMVIRSQNIERPNASFEIVSNLSHRPSAKADGMTPFCGGSGRVSDSHYDGISLREWLNLKRQKINKTERLHIFKQILELVDISHSQGLALHHLRPSYFIILPSNQVKYVGSFIPQGQMKQLSGSVNQDFFPLGHHLKRKRYMEQGKEACEILMLKHQQLSEHHSTGTQHHIYPPRVGLKGEGQGGEIDIHISSARNSGYDLIRFAEPYDTCNISNSPSISSSSTQQSISEFLKLEQRWYASPEEPNESICHFSSNIYSLGVLLFELFCYFASWEVHSAAMSDLCHRILPPNFLSESPKEASFCLWLLHPEPSSRPKSRDVLLRDLISEGRDLSSLDRSSAVIDEEDAEADLLLHFLLSLKEQKEKRAAKLVADLGCLKADVEEVERRHSSRANFVSSGKNLQPNFSDISEMYPCKEPVQAEDISRMSRSSIYQERLMRNIDQLENAYFSMRSRVEISETNAPTRSDIDILKFRDKCYGVENDTDMWTESTDCLGAFFDGLCKYARYSKFEVRGSLKNVDILNSANVICSLSFDQDEDYLAAAGVSKKIKIFEFNALLNNNVDIHYPLIEMSSRSKLSCVCWNNYIKNYLASTDYEGVVQKNCIDTIRNVANVCCVQFSPHSSHLLAFGSADYKIYCYDLRNTRIPWCTLAGHGKAVSYVKFLDSETLVSASTDSSLKLWDLNRTNASGLSSGACTLTLSGHTNEKNFVGLSVSDGYIACGSETNEVYAYYKTFSMPITSHEFGSIDPMTGQETSDDNGQFVSSVCWRGKSNMVVAANSSGSIKVLQMV